MMKYTIILITLLLARLSFAQQDSLAAGKAPKKRYEAGVNIYSLRARGGDFYSSYKTIIDNYVFTGLYFKSYHGKYATRYAFDYLQKLINSGRSFYSPPGGIISSKTLQLSAGCQRFFGHRKVVPYVFADVSLGWTREFKPVNDYNAFPFYSSYHNSYSPYEVQNSLLVGISPGIGLRITLHRNLVLNLEGSAQFFYQWLKPVINSSQTDRSMGINARPLQCSLGFTF